MTVLDIQRQKSLLILYQKYKIWNVQSGTQKAAPAYSFILKKEFSVCRRSLFIIYLDSFQTDEIRQVY